MKIGYIKQSNMRRKLEIERDSLIKKGCQRIYVEGLYQSKSHKIELKFLIAQLKAEDIIYTKSLSSFSTKLSSLHAIIEDIKFRKVHLITLDGIIDTRTSHGSIALEFLVSLPDVKRAKVIKILQQKRRYTKYL